MHVRSSGLVLCVLLFLYQQWVMQVHYRAGVFSHPYKEVHTVGKKPPHWSQKYSPRDCGDYISQISQSGLPLTRAVALVEFFTT